VILLVQVHIKSHICLLSDLVDLSNDVL
jgi:hypothetical protein